MRARHDRQLRPPVRGVLLIRFRRIRYRPAEGARLELGALIDIDGRVEAIETPADRLRPLRGAEQVARLRMSLRICVLRDFEALPATFGPAELGPVEPVPNEVEPILWVQAQLGKRGRPREYGPDVGAKLHQLISEGRSLRAAAQDLQVPFATAQRLYREWRAGAGLVGAEEPTVGERCYRAFQELRAWPAVACEVLPKSEAEAPARVALALAKRWARKTGAAWPIPAQMSPASRKSQLQQGLDADGVPSEMTLRELVGVVLGEQGGLGHDSPSSS